MDQEQRPIGALIVVGIVAVFILAFWFFYFAAFISRG